MFNVQDHNALLEEKKTCFWLNMINFAILGKLLELKIAKAKILKEELNF